MPPLTRIALLGVNGILGAPLLDHLVAVAGKHNYEISVLQRKSSRSKPAHASIIKIISIPDDLTAPDSHQALVTALTHQEAVIVSIEVRDVATHTALAAAAAEAGVRRFFPADWGSVDSSAARSQKVVPLFGRKVEIRAHLEKLAAKYSGFTWTSIVGGHFFDWGLREGFMHVDFKIRQTDVFDDGEGKSSLTTLQQYAKAVVAVLDVAGQASGKDETANRMLFIQSFCVSQNELVASLEKATGAKWEEKQYDLQKYIKDKKVEADAGDHQANEDLVFALGVEDGDWRKKEGYAMELLGLIEESLDEVVGGIVAELK
jgi:nucleoside-diphosphate-sugar epimerase